MSDIYLIDFKKLVALLLPIRLRSTKIIAWLKVLVFPISKIHHRFLLKQRLDSYKLSHNGQACHLRKVLNDAFDSTLRRIQIVDGNRFEKSFIYTKGENKPQFLGIKYIYDRSVFDDTGADFLVLIPLELWNRKKTQISIGEYRFYDIEAIVDYYKLASKRYKIQLL